MIGVNLTCNELEDYDMCIIVNSLSLAEADRELRGRLYSP